MVRTTRVPAFWIRSTLLGLMDDQFLKPFDFIGSFFKKSSEPIWLTLLYTLAGRNLSANLSSLTQSVNEVFTHVLSFRKVKSG